MGKTNSQLDKWDVAISVSSGVLTAGMDVLWVQDISLMEAHTWGKDETEKFVIKTAKSKGFTGNDLAGAITFLEDKFPMAGDLLTDKFGGGPQHHLRDFSHHPTVFGLICSILMQFTGYGIGTDTAGKISVYKIKNWKKPSFEKGIYLGTVEWFFHLISDVSGSNKTVRRKGEGTGIPGPLLSFLKEISSLPGIRNIAGKSKDNYEFSKACFKLFNGTLSEERDESGKQLRFDFRTELGIAHSSMESKQYLPVVLNEIIVSAFYSVRRFLREIEENQISTMKEIGNIDMKKCLPFRNNTLKHMRMLATATFSSIDIFVAGLKAAAKNKNNRNGFALDFLQGINYWGIGSLTLSVNSELVLGIEKMHSGFVSALEEQKKKVFERIPNGEEMWNSAKASATVAVSVVKMGTPIGFISAAVGVYDQIKIVFRDLEEATERREEIEKDCEEKIQIINEYKQDIEQSVSDYLYGKMTVFTRSIQNMDRAITENDIEGFITGNNIIQKELSGKAMFNDFKEFDEMMLTKDSIKF